MRRIQAMTSMGFCVTRSLGAQHRMALGKRTGGAQGERQHRVGILFDQAETGGEFGQRRRQVGLDAERKLAGVGERAACVILESPGQLQCERRGFGKGPLNSSCWV